jgi:hypothetical protein
MEVPAPVDVGIAPDEKKETGEGERSHAFKGLHEGGSEACHHAPIMADE